MGQKDEFFVFYRLVKVCVTMYGPDEFDAPLHSLRWMIGDIEGLHMLQSDFCTCEKKRKFVGVCESDRRPRSKIARSAKEIFPEFKAHFDKFL